MTFRFAEFEIKEKFHLTRSIVNYLIPLQRDLQEPLHHSLPVRIDSLHNYNDKLVGRADTGRVTYSSAAVRYYSSIPGSINIHFQDHKT
jgi:uncharacterized protein YpuA (DUF1002 family)